MQPLKCSVILAAICSAATVAATTPETAAYVKEMHAIERAFGRELARSDNGKRIREVAIEQRGRTAELLVRYRAVKIPDDCREAGERLHLFFQFFLLPSSGEEALEAARLKFRRSIKDCEIETGIRQNRQFGR
ncbi:MAG: hypothetical protein DI527_02115 [Chelatococcus sp.]|nr:MAG: hypothetical protein DI527_02115 [Chelatococcus sp.]